VRVNDHYPQAGGEPSLSIDFLQLDMDGSVYEIDPNTRERRVYRPQAKIQLRIVFPNNLKPDYARKALRKLDEYPCLEADLQTRQALEKAAGVQA